MGTRRIYTRDVGSSGFDFAFFGRTVCEAWQDVFGVEFVEGGD